MPRALWVGGLLLGLMLGAPRAADAAILTTGRVVAVEDGAHVVVLRNGVRHRVRLIGVDDPYGEEARAFVAGEILGQEVRLELDSWTPDAEGAWLAYVYPVARPGVIVNVEILDRGYARVWDRGPRWHYRPTFYAAEARARARHAAIWREEVREEREARHGGGGGHSRGRGHHH